MSQRLCTGLMAKLQRAGGPIHRQARGPPILFHQMLQDAPTTPGRISEALFFLRERLRIDSRFPKVWGSVDKGKEEFSLALFWTDPLYAECPSKQDSDQPASLANRRN